MVQLYTQALNLLEEAVRTEDLAQKKAYLQDYLGLESMRQDLLPEAVLIQEDYYERVEGTAQYIEAKVYQTLTSTEEMAATYIEPIGHYSNGTAKYYRIGLAKCLLLDALHPTWKEGYDFATCLTDLLYTYLK